MNVGNYLKYFKEKQNRYKINSYPKNIQINQNRINLPPINYYDHYKDNYYGQHPPYIPKKNYAIIDEFDNSKEKEQNKKRIDSYSNARLPSEYIDLSYNNE